jgi:hypothetical protein
MYEVEKTDGQGPGDGPEVDAAITTLAASLARALGPDTEYVVLILARRGAVSHLQAVTNSTERRARDLMRIVDGRGFDSIN